MFCVQCTDITASNGYKLSNHQWTKIQQIIQGKELQPKGL